MTLSLLGIFLVVQPLFSETLPQRYPLERYDELRKHLPFGKPTVIETEAAKPPPFTDDLALLGFSKVGSGYFVTLTNKKTQQKIFLSPKEKPDGITVAEVINSSDLTKVEIKLKKGDEVSSLKFDPTFLSGPKPGAMPIQPQPGVMTQGAPIPPSNVTPPNGTPPEGTNVPPSQPAQILRRTRRVNMPISPPPSP
ncbi:MAG: hypothetical protein V4507_01205 [Verrucomicrobiota bacterium]